MGEAQDDCGKCPSGYFCPQQTKQPHICPRGYYCPEETEIPIPCPIGTFGAGEGLPTEADCTSCYGGRYCSQYGLESPDGLCDKAFYCVDESMTPVPSTVWVGEVGNTCEAGGFCPQGSKFPRPCKPGFYNFKPGKFDESGCEPCIDGSYCSGDPQCTEAEVTAGTCTRTDVTNDLLKYSIPSPAPTGLCKAGYYCTQYTDSTTGLLTGSSNIKQQIATPGHWTAEGASAEENCLAGTFQSEYG